MIALPEVLVTAPLMIATLGAVLSFNLVSVNEQDRVEGRVRADVDEQVVLQRMTRELRQATRFIDQQPTYVEFVALIHQNGSGSAEPRQIRYECNGPGSPGTCVRREGPEGSLGAPVVLLDDNGKRLVNSDVFAIDPRLVDDPNDTTEPYDQIFNEKPRTATVKLAVLTESSFGDRSPGPTHPTVLTDRVELRNTRPGPDDGLGACDVVPEPAACNVE